MLYDSNASDVIYADGIQFDPSSDSIPLDPMKLHTNSWDVQIAQSHRFLFDQDPLQ